MKTLQRVLSGMTVIAIAILAVASPTGTKLKERETARPYLIVADAATTNATASQYWYNGAPSINPQANNTFKFADGSTTAYGRTQTFTSQQAPSNFHIVNTFGGVQSVKIDYIQTIQGSNSLTITSPTSIDSEIDYLCGNQSLIIDEVQAGGGTSLRTAAIALGLDPDTDTMGAMYLASMGYSSVGEVKRDFAACFYIRNLWHLTTDGVTSWCLQPQTMIGTTNTVSGSSVVGTEQWANTVSLIAGSAMALGADTNEAYYQAAQCLIWEVVGGLVDYNTLEHTSTSDYYNGMIVGNGLQARYGDIKSKTLDSKLIPSFLSSYVRSANGNTKTYYYPATWVKDHYELADSLILTDNNGLVDKWVWNDTDVYHFEVIDAHHLKVVAKKYSGTTEGPIGFGSSCSHEVSAPNSYYDSNAQAQITYDGLYDPYVGYMSISMKSGTRFKSDTEDNFPVSGDISGTKVKITGPGFDGTTEYDINSLPQISTPGTYTVTETHAPMFSDEHLGYVKDTTQSFTFTVTPETASNWFTTYMGEGLHDKRQKVQIQVQKHDTEVTKDKLINGTIVDSYNDYTVTTDLTSVFDVYAYEDIYLADGSIKWHKDDLITSITTNAQGYGISEEIDLGVMYVKERTAPFGYHNDDRTHSEAGYNEHCQIIDAKYKGEDIATWKYDTLDFYNKRQKMQIQIDKKDTENYDTVNSGLKTTYEIWTAEDIKTPDGSVVLIPANTYIETLVSDDTGYAISSELDVGLYKVLEVNAPSGDISNTREHGYLLNTNTNITAGAVHTDEQDVAVFRSEEDGTVNSANANSVDSSKSLFVALQDKRQKGVILVQKEDHMKTYLNHAPTYEEYIDCVICHENFLTCGHTTEEYNKALEEYHDNDLVRGVNCPVCGGTFPMCGCDVETYKKAFAEQRPIDMDDPFYDTHEMRNVNPIPQGDASFIGATFNIYAEEDIILPDGSTAYHAGELVDTITTVAKGTEFNYAENTDKYGVVAPTYTLITTEDGQAYSKELDVGKYRIVETSPSTGYQFEHWRDSNAGYVVEISYTGDMTEQSHEYYQRYANDVILGHLSITKLLSHEISNDLVNNELTKDNPDYNPAVETDIPVKNTYFAVYLKSKENSINEFKNTRLPDEFFFSSALDDTAPPQVIKEGAGEIVDGYHYGCYQWADTNGKPNGTFINPTLDYPFDEELANQAIKSLYLILKTNDKGKASTYDLSTVVYVNFPYIDKVGDIDIHNGVLDTGLGIIDYSVPLPYGEYVVKELTPPEGYDDKEGVIDGTAVDDVEWTVTIGDECKVINGNPYVSSTTNNKSYTIKNNVLQQTIYVYKVDEQFYVRENESTGGENQFELIPENGIIPQANVQFKLWCWNNGHDSSQKDNEPLTGNGKYGNTYDPADIGNTEKGYWYTYTAVDPDTFNTTVIDTFATDENGMFTLPSNLVYGDYSFVELNAPYGYWLPSEDNTDVKDVPLNADGTPQKWIGYVNEDGEFVYTPDKWGHTYDKAVNATNFTVNNPDGTIRVTVDAVNQAQKGYVVLQKTGLKFTSKDVVTNDKYTENHPVFEIKGLEGAEYGLYAAEDIYSQSVNKEGTPNLIYEKDELIEKLTTDERGLVVSAPLNLGKYYIKETKAPYGYVLDESKYDVELTYQGQEVRIFPVNMECYDIRQEVQFEVYKESEEIDGTFVPTKGSVKFGLFAAEDIPNFTGEKAIKKDDLIEVIDIVDGKGASSLQLPIAKYYVQELETNEDEFLLDTNKYPIEFKYTADGFAYDSEGNYKENVTAAGKGETLLVIKLNEGVAVKNYRLRADVELFKSDANYAAELRDVNTREVPMFDYNFDGVIDDKDVEVFDDFYNGKATPTDDELIMSDFDCDGKITKADKEQIDKVVKDNTVNSNVTIDLPSKLYGQRKKVNNTDKALMLEGVEFDLYQTALDGEVFAEPKYIAKLTTNEYGYASYNNGLIRGTYKLVETKNGDRYKFDPENPLTVEFEVTTDMYNTILTYNLENTAEDALLITKKDVSTGALIPNTKFEIKNSETGEIVAKGITDKDGEAYFKLEEGKYTYKEYEAAPGYILDETEFPFEIKKDGGIVKAVMTNQKKPTDNGGGGSAPVGIIRFWIGNGVWNPRTASFDIDTEAITPTELNANTEIKGDINPVNAALAVILVLSLTGSVVIFKKICKE